MLVLCVGFARNRIFALYYASRGVSLVIGYMLHLSTTDSEHSTERPESNPPKPTAISRDSSVSARLAAKKPDPRLERFGEDMGRSTPAALLGGGGFRSVHPSVDLKGPFLNDGSTSRPGNIAGGGLRRTSLTNLRRRI